MTNEAGTVKGRAEFTKAEFGTIYCNLIQDLELMKKYDLANKMIENPAHFVNWFLFKFPLDPAITH